MASIRYILGNTFAITASITILILGEILRLMYYNINNQIVTDKKLLSANPRYVKHFTELHSIYII